MKRIKSTIMLVGRRWFNKNVGNTYHSCEIYVDGTCVHKIPYAYGYGQQYEDNAKTWLIENKYLPGIETKEGTPGEALFRYCERMGIIYNQTVTDVQRKKDL
ncbi:hypothetical protein [Nitrospira sp. BLG_2]|uniref:hypothetical protein n=1 Tax=Nitrospira sp. BLG_2 TaxID=3397507 RepID=UPI003B991158